MIMKIKDAIAIINEKEKQKTKKSKPKYDSIKGREYYQKNREHVKEKAREYYWNNIEKRKEAHAAWYQKNREYVRNYQRVYKHNCRINKTNIVTFEDQRIEAEI